MFDVIIAGSGPAGVFSAYSLRGRNVLVLDVGHRPPPPPDLEGNLYTLRQQREDLFPELIGVNYEGLHNLHQREISLKLKAPFMSYIVRDWERLMPVRSRNFHPVASFAVGGLANAWGAGVYRFNARDLEGFPISAAELEPYYDELARHIGISGAHDALEMYFGSEPSLQPPTRIPRLSSELLERSTANRAWLQQRGITVGRSRLAVLTKPHRGRAPYAYENLEFYRPNNPAIYNPAFTLDEMTARGEATLRTGYCVSHFRESGDGVDVIARNVATGEYETFSGKRLILAAGALGSAKIALASQRDYQTRLPILDNPMACIPLIRLDRIGAALEVGDGAIGHLNVVYDDAETGDLLQASVYGTTGPLRSDVLFQFPLSVSANLVWARYLSPAMTLMMVFYPGKQEAGNYLRLSEDGTLEINYEWKSTGRPERRLIQAFRHIGYHSAAPLCQYPAMGNSLHYAGLLPMQAAPGPYQTNSEGRLYGTNAVYVTDGAAFSRLPAKNLTFTIMANAARIGALVRRTLE